MHHDNAFRFTWRNAQGQAVGNSPILNISLQGNYSLEIDFMGICSYVSTSYNTTNFNPFPMVFPGNDLEKGIDMATDMQNNWD